LATTPVLLTPSLYINIHDPHVYSFPTPRSSDLNLFDNKLLCKKVGFACVINEENIIITIATYIINTLYNFFTMFFFLPCYFPFKDQKSTRLNSIHVSISYSVLCLKKKNKNIIAT